MCHCETLADKSSTCVSQTGRRGKCGPVAVISWSHGHTPQQTQPQLGERRKRVKLAERWGTKGTQERRLRIAFSTC